MFLTNTGTVRVITSSGSSLLRAGERYVEFIASAPHTHWLGGFARASKPGAGDIDFAVYFTGTGAVEVWEKGIPKASIPQNAGEVFRVTVSSHRVQYSKNGVVFYTSPRIPTYPLLFRTARVPDHSTEQNSFAAQSASTSGTLDGRKPRPLASNDDRPVPAPAATSAIDWRPAPPALRDADLPEPRLSDLGNANQNVGTLSLGTGTGGSLPPSIGPPPPIAPPRGTGSGTLVTVRFVGVGQDGGLIRGSSFSEASLRDLLIDVTWNLPGGGHTQRLELFSPDGALYQRFTAALGIGQQTIETRVPVGGTWITQYSLFGPWSASVYLDDQTIPTTSAGFVLAQ